MIKKRQYRPTLQIITAPKVGRPKKTNGEYEPNGIDKNSRSFETRFVPRYKKIPSLPRGLPQPAFSESSNKILKERYLLKGGNLEVTETVSERFWHIAYDIASADFDFSVPGKQVFETAKLFYTMMVNQEFLPNSPTIMNAGKQNGLQYSACFVLPVGDSIGEIFDSVKYAAQIHKSGGGTGFAFSRLRPKDSIVATTGGVASGPVSFLRVFNAATEAIKQGGCFSEDALIMTHLGLVPIKEIVEQKRTWYVATHLGLQQVTAKFDNGQKKLYQVKTQAGFTVKVTAGHKFLTADKMGHFYLKPLSDFQVDDHLTLLLGAWPEDIPYALLNTAIPQKSKYSYGRIDINLPKHLDEKLAFLIGVYHADGSKISDEYSPNGKGLRVAVAENRPQDLLKLTKTIKDIFGLDCTITKGDGAVYNVNCFSRSVNEFLALNGLLKESSVAVTVPDMIFTSPRRVIESYIAGVFLGDGGNRGGKGGFRISTVSKTFAQQIQVLLLNLGIASKIAVENRQSKNWRDLYNVTINGNRFMKKFAVVISPYTEKVNDHPVSHKDYAFRWPFNLTEKYLHLSGIQSVTPVGNISTTQKTVAFLQQNVGFINEQDRNDISLLASCVSDKIASIEYIGKGYVYDLEVGNTHLLSGNGFYTSNSRRGANMGILRIDHPDILEFIRCKAELDDTNKPIFESVAPLLPDDSTREYFKTLLLDKQISNFNISCAITEKFMEALEKDKDYDLIDPHSGEAVGKLNARQVFDEIVERAWATGDPGLIFIDRINNSPANPVPSLETIESTNPCGEQPLASWDACNLGSINLGKFVKGDGSGVDWERLGNTVKLAVHFLDNVVQTNPFTLKQIYDEVHQNRRIGLGVMGWADMLFILKIPYNSEEALKLAEQVMQFINEEGHKMSEDLAQVRGSFPNWSNSIYADGNPIRNSTITTIAPTGTISIIGDCSSGIEPVFALAYIHKAKSVGDQYRILTIANQTFAEIAREKGFWSDDLAEKVLEKGSVAGIPEVPEEWQKVFVTAPEIDPIFHVKMQAAFQKYTDNGVSKTINLPNSATVDDVRTAYMLSYQTGCNGITIYRDGSKAVQVLNVSSALQKTQQEVIPVAERPMILRGRTYKVSTPVGEAFITINRDEQDQPFEVFVTVGKGGMHTMADAEAMGRLVSLSLRLSRAGKSLPKEVAQKITQQLRGIGGASTVGFGKNRVMSLADAIAKVLSEDSAQSSTAQTAEPIPLNLTSSSKTQADLCPECGSASFVMEEGCKKCHSCGYSMC
ncbi:adenosylcobalamin-dependent ribonucleoside-diphosphate reductase [Candidatus Daviesbacteria bacterium]|nr:adenosylcobalamin-dependent ribonucleoside-diphosphate reductase [Candidatus Daviesbacteria bacterium]